MSDAPEGPGKGGGGGSPPPAGDTNSTAVQDTRLYTAPAAPSRPSSGLDDSTLAASRKPAPFPPASLDEDQPGAATGRPGPAYLPPHLIPLQDKFEFLEKLGDGGFGEVWCVRLRDSVLDVERAVKVIKAEAANDRQFVERMVREAQAMARLNHPHAVTVHSASRDPAYIEMDYIRGKTLDQVLKEAGRGQPMDLDWTAQFLAQLCSVLQVAHKNQIIHRDLKPSNLMLAGSDDGELNLKVLDFGIAKFLNPAPDAFKTFGGAPMTPMYASPEQVRDETNLDARSDIFATGLILYQLLTGHHPYWSPDDSIHATMVDILSKPAPPFRERNPEVCVPESIERLVLRCLEKDPAQRPASAAALADEFRRLLSAATTLKNPVAPEPAKLAIPWWQRLRIVAPLLIVASSAGAALGMLAVSRVPRVPAVLPSIKAVPNPLEIRAGTFDNIDIFAQDAPSEPIQVRVLPGYPEGILVHPTQITGGVAPRFRVEVSPDFVPGDTPVRQQLAFAVSLGGKPQKLTVALEIAPPDLPRLPGDWVRSPNSKLVKIGEKYYPREIEQAPGGVAVTALLIERKTAQPGAIQPEPFYIMKDKVWVALFEVFARAHPEVVPDSGWHQGSDPRLPVRNVTGLQAQAFATWLGGPGHGFLPTPEQWDQAAGRNLVKAPAGPFQEPLDPNDGSQVAVNRRQPMPVGQASRDVSPYGCRDMSGNGWEWTRPRPGDEEAVLRAQSFKWVRPFQFEDIKNADIGAKDFDKRDDVTGFRVVIELDPSG